MGDYVTITPGAATDDAVQIDKIIADISAEMETLNTAIKSNIPDRVATDWSETLLNNWEQYYGADVPEAMAAMGESATNLKLAVEKALGYSNEN